MEKDVVFLNDAQSADVGVCECSWRGKYQTFQGV